MLELLTRNWWALALRGVLAILLGLVCLAWPGVALVALVILIGVYILADGILAAISGLSERVKGWGLLLLEGILLIIVGFAVFRWPGITALSLLILIAVRAIILGVLQIAEAIRLRKQVEGEWLLGLAGVVSILFGLLLLAMPAVGLLAVVWLIGIYAIIFGVLMISLGFRLKGWGHKMIGPAPA
jgi:uncharacterized membrane protein HdeD (DUF308 family)